MRHQIRAGVHHHWGSLNEMMGPLLVASRIAWVLRTLSKFQVLLGTLADLPDERH